MLVKSTAIGAMLITYGIFRLTTTIVRITS